ncbi:MAG TPA: hypothetical protein VI282_01840, partial [Verrucomicrobiae bacterium]
TTHPSRRRVWLARSIAVAADGLQFILFPMFAEGFASPLEIATDVIVAALMTLLVGWHIAFIPSFLLESLPFMDLAPTWTIAVLVATRTRGQPQPPIIDVTEKPRADADNNR